MVSMTTAVLCRLPPDTSTLVRWRMNMVVTSPVITTTCGTCPSCSGLTSVRRWCSSPRTALRSASWSAAQYKVSMPPLTSGQVGSASLTLQMLSNRKTTNSYIPVWLINEWSNFGWSLTLTSCGSCTTTCVLIFVLIGANLTAAFGAQRQAEPHGPLARQFPPYVLHTLILKNTFILRRSLGVPPVLTGEFWILHRLAGPLGLPSLCRIDCGHGQNPLLHPGPRSKCQPVSLQHIQERFRHTIWDGYLLFI